jgi:SAM-dependent methyltransferase
MKTGNRLLASLFARPAVRRATAAAATTFGQHGTLGALSVLGLRGRVSRGRRELERCIVAPHLPRAGAVLLIGVQSYNYHYICFYRAFNEVVVVEPYAPIEVPSGVTLLRERLGDVSLPAGAFDLVNFVGVYGWGLDAPDEVARACAKVAASLAPGGRLLFAFNRDHDPLGLADDPARRAALFPGVTFRDWLPTRDGTALMGVGERQAA